MGWVVSAVSTWSLLKLGLVLSTPSLVANIRLECTALVSHFHLECAWPGKHRTGDASVRSRASEGGLSHPPHPDVGGKTPAMMARSTVSHLMAVLHCVYHSSHVSAQDAGGRGEKEEEEGGQQGVGREHQKTHSNQQASTGSWGEGEGVTGQWGLAAV